MRFAPWFGLRFALWFELRFGRHLAENGATALADCDCGGGSALTSIPLSIIAVWGVS